ncbi:rod shape-determining protein RodA, partial [candidate division KSB1 bacterium]
MLDEFDLKKKFKYFDFSVFFSMILLIGIGIAAIYSATYSSGSAAHLNYQRQILWAGLGLIVFAVIVFTPMRFFLAFAYVFYGVAIASLLLVLVIGQKGSGAQRWLGLGFLHFQPSEWAKLATIFVIARLFT